MQVISKKDQAPYWHHMEVPYSYVSVDMFARKFKESPYEKKLDEKLSEPYDKSQSHKDALSFSLYSLSKWELFRACASRELLLMKRNSFLYIFKTIQVRICTFAYVLHSVTDFSFYTLAKVLQIGNSFWSFLSAAFYHCMHHNDCIFTD
jgi:hypothetical protein